jgi:hypothetical protein
MKACKFIQTLIHIPIIKGDISKINFMKCMFQEEHQTGTVCMLKVDTCTMTQAISCHHVTKDVRFHSRPVHVGFVVDRVAVETVSSWYFILSLSISFYQCSIPISLIYH